MNAITAVVKATAAVLLLNVLYKVCLEAYEIRLYAIKEFGPVIHEFDPYFNYRATEVSLQLLRKFGWIYGWRRVKDGSMRETLDFLELPPLKSKPMYG